ncbi:T9SS type A sorting domain-containing protein [Flavobacterium soyangense]|uniref:T9SS type A sorting domain-containing protein n=1 Tax=Flavobacterium soyangense TaxID=2023265 RepID=A0A930XUY8_9FLAO|nr:T9SS type A sorting domain-containing protein [Flavobacterium soyangense]MBF2707537.1 T9SS type A sorting domain-containing protein [Flavobacterium soyangense]
MKTKLLSLALFAFALFFSASLFAQTAGSMTFNFTTVKQGSATKQVDAVWIENAVGIFIKTNLLYIGDGTSDHLPQFSLKSGANGIATNGNGGVQDATTGNTINAITGATRTSSTAPLAWGPYSVSWDGKTGATTPVLVPDGSYKVWVEMAWIDGTPDTHDFINTGYSFTKGASIATTNPANAGPLSAMTLTWTPSALSLDSVYKTKIAIYPNPSNGIINVQYNDIPVSNIDVVNVLGQIVKSLKIDSSKSETSQSIDLSGNANGLYIINVSTNETSSSYKVVLDK